MLTLDVGDSHVIMQRHPKNYLITVGCGDEAVLRRLLKNFQIVVRDAGSSFKHRYRTDVSRRIASAVVADYVTTMDLEVGEVR